MLQIHFSNRYEVLQQQLLARLALGRTDVFRADQVIVPSAALRRAVTLAIADAQGLCANVQFGFLAQWLWQQMGRVLPAVGTQSPFAPAPLTWRVYGILGDAGFVAAHARLAAYLHDADDLMRFELAGRVAHLLEQYITYRPDWLDAWRQGRRVGAGSAPEAPHPDQDWQAALWRRLVDALGVDTAHPSVAFVDTLEREGPALARAAGLPLHAHVFALPAMPPLHIGLLAQLGRWMDLDLYVLNPCQAYWFEVVDRRRLTRLAARGQAQGHEEGNRLLAAWGRQTQAFIDTLVEHCGDAEIDDSGFLPAPGTSLLARWQNAVLALEELTPGSVTLDDDDRSVELHVCHSLTRELEVLQDQLLGLFAADTGLRPGEVLVVTPDLDAAAPLIDAVFGTAPDDRRLPYAITGRARSSAHAPARALLALLALAASRCTASEVMGLLQQPIVARRFGLDEAGLQQLHDGLRDAGVHWGLDAGHRAGFGLPADGRHTLADGLDRLFLGYALPSAIAEPFGTLLPAGRTEGASASVLGAFWQFVDALRQLHAGLAMAHPAAEWQALLLDAIDHFFDPAGDELDDVAELEDALRGMTETLLRGGLDEAVPWPVLRAALAQALDDPARGGVPTGSITFSAMGSLRGLPFQVICVVGLNDGAFPTAQRAPEFDLMAGQPRRGDRQRRHDERNLFLDLLLGARQRVILSTTGRSVRDNSPLPPSVLVSEWLEVLVPAIASDPDDAAALARARRRLVVEHPLQPFSVEHFAADADPRVRSFNREFGDALRRSLQAPAARPTATPPAASDDGDDERRAADPQAPFFGQPLAPPDAAWRTVSVAQLVAFFRNPCRYLLQRRLGLALQYAADELQDEEPFLPDWPGRSALAARLLPALLAGADPQAVQRLALAGTEWPSGALGRQQMTQVLATLGGFAARVRTATAAPCLPPHAVRLEVDLDGETWQLQADFADLRPQGLVRWRCDELRPGDRIEAWLQHLVLCAAPPPDAARRTEWLALEAGFALRPPTAPQGELQALLGLYRRGLREPLPFYPKAAWACVERGGSLSAARSVWQPTADRPFAEGSDPAYRLALRGLGDPLAGEFAALAEAVFGPLRAHLDDGA